MRLVRAITLVAGLGTLALIAYAAPSIHAECDRAGPVKKLFSCDGRY